MAFDHFARPRPEGGWARHTPNDRLVYAFTVSTRVVGYIRVSTDEQSASGAGLDAQRQAIAAEAARRGWEVAAVYEYRGASAKRLAGRPGLQDALRAVETGNATALVAAKVDRLSRSVSDFCGLLERSRRKGWSLVALDIGLDTMSPSGEMMAHVVSSFGQYERRLIGQRTRDALAVRRQQGVRLGRPVGTEPRTAARIKRLNRAGRSLSAIAAALNASATPTAQGGRQWYPSTVRKVLLRLSRPAGKIAGHRAA
jgi:DNA invertase Pin-like site-specific DNA recombinase